MIEDCLRYHLLLITTSIPSTAIGIDPRRYQFSVSLSERFVCLFLFFFSFVLIFSP